MRPQAMFAAAIILSFAIAAAPAVAQDAKGDPEGPEGRPSVEALTRNFESIVFGSEIKGVDESTVIWKWSGPLRVAVRSYEEVMVDQDGRQVVRLKQVKSKLPHIKFIKKHLTTLVRATGLITEDVKKTGEEPNFFINFVPHNHMGNPNLVKTDPSLLKRLAAEGGCYFVGHLGKVPGELRRADIVVNAERLLIHINHCLLEEMTQSLGLPNDSNTISPSIFTQNSRRTELARTDLLMLKTLYHPKMKAGMPREDAMALANIIIKRLDVTLP